MDWLRIIDNRGGVGDVVILVIGDVSYHEALTQFQEEFRFLLL